MCDACINRERELLAALEPEQREVVDRYIEHEVETQTENADQENTSLRVQLEKARDLVEPLKELIDKFFPDGNTPVGELLDCIKNGATIRAQVESLRDELIGKEG